ncbi:MAG: aldehyde dehydrogenase family protein [Cyclobacteriaceae bacterium]|nr:aldehyde dehydrogenase family protein [Cyclobacteriaceae bacterium]
MEITTEKTALLPLKLAFERQRSKSFLLRKEPLKERTSRLVKLEKWINTNRERIKESVHADFNKPLLEVDTTEIYPVLTEIRHTLKHIEEWSRPKKIDATLSYIGTRAEIRYEPKGVCLIIAPWNFPFNLCVGPLVSCLAAGNTVIIKPSEMTPSTSRLLKAMMGEIFEEDIVTVVEGGAEVSQTLLEFPFDHIFFTGSPSVGKVVMKAASQNLTSVTLELGGKSPTIIDASANLNDAAKRIAFGKFLNNGQTCIAPDYILIEESIQKKFIDKLKKEIEALFGEGKLVSESSPNYARIVNARHFQRINDLLKDAVEKGATPDMMGSINASSNFIPPVILSNLSSDSKILEEEIFGPILPVITFKSRDEVVQQVNSRPKPLALYIFSQKNDFREFVLQNTSAGGVCINECILQFTHPNLPFGGVNNSGIGKSHGYFGFMAFSNEKPILRQKSGWSAPYLLHPPYTQKMKKIVDILLRWF